MTDNGNTGMIMPVSPYGGNGGFGGFGGDWGWIILLLLFAGGGYGFGGGFGGGEIYPWMNQADITTNGFQNLQTNNAISSVQSSLGDIQNSLCNGFAGVNASISNGFAQSEIADNARQIANMQQMFDIQTQFANCCCENRLANCQTQNVIQSEGSATRFADANNTRDILENCNRNNQAILDKLCQLELDGVKAQVDAKNDRIAELQTQLNMATLRESQTAQNAFISQGFANEVDQLYNRLSNCPVPSTPVYGRTPIFTCNQNQGCGCGCGNNF